MNPIASAKRLFVTANRDAVQSRWYRPTHDGRPRGLRIVAIPLFLVSFAFPALGQPLSHATSRTGEHQAAEPLFPSPYLPAWREVNAFTIGDINGDATPDIVAALDLFQSWENGQEGSVGIALGRGDGTFHPMKGVDLPENDMSLCIIGDLDQDGHADIVARNWDWSRGWLYVLYGDGTGGVEEFHPYQIGRGRGDVFIRDLNADSLPDIATLNSESNNISILMNAGGRSFDTPLARPVVHELVDFALGPLAGDGTVGIVVAYKNRYNECGLVAYRSIIEHEPVWEWEADRCYHAISILGLTQLTGDQNPDLFVIGLDSSPLTFRGQGDGTFAEPVETPVFKSQSAGRSLYDFDRDGYLDIIGVGGVDGIRVSFGNASGDFAEGIHFPTGGSVDAIAAADFNGDDVTDFALLASHGIAVRLGDPAGEYAPFIFNESRYYHDFVAVADFNADGFCDVLSGNDGRDVAYLDLADGAGSFEVADPVAICGEPVPVATGDFDGDGSPDIVAGFDDFNGFAVIRNRGDGTFEDPLCMPEPVTSERLWVADLNDDGMQDFTNGRRIMFGQPNGTFWHDWQQDLGLRDHPLAFGDIDNNGTTDIITAGYSEDKPYILLGLGGGVFAEPREVVVPGWCKSVSLADLDDDGNLDLFVCSDYRWQSLFLLRGNGDGSFQPHLEYPLPEQARDARIVDIDGDGYRDVILPLWRTEAFMVLYGAQEGLSGAHQLYYLPHEPHFLFVKELNGDGVLDILAIAENELSLCVLPGNPDRVHPGDAATNAPSVHSADRDEDGAISLSELLRQIQFYRSGHLHCRDNTEDGYAPGPGDQSSCDASAADTRPRDWEIDLSELLRIIQLYRANGYHRCQATDTPDGYCLGQT